LETIEKIAENIEANIDLTAQLEMICRCYKIDLNASPLYNFRDALSHYILRYEATADEEKIAQEASIKEHIFRGTKDIIVLILNEMKYRVLDVLNPTSRREQQQDFRRLLHGYKKLELEIRKNTESAVIRSLTPFVEALTNLIEETKVIFELHGIDFYA